MKLSSPVIRDSRASASFIPPNSPAMYLFHMLISVSFGSRLRRAYTHVAIPFAISSAFPLPLTS